MTTPWGCLRCNMSAHGVTAEGSDVLVVSVSGRGDVWEKVAAVGTVVTSQYSIGQKKNLCDEITCSDRPRIYH
jgi:hypothetical protein